jgi:hypothetical protein
MIMHLQSPSTVRLGHNGGPALPATVSWLNAADPDDQATHPAMVLKMISQAPVPSFVEEPLRAISTKLEATQSGSFTRADLMQVGSAIKRILAKVEHDRAIEQAADHLYARARDYVEARNPLRGRAKGSFGRRSHDCVDAVYEALEGFRQALGNARPSQLARDLGLT